MEVRALMCSPMSKSMPVATKSAWEESWPLESKELEHCNCGADLVLEELAMDTGCHDQEKESLLGTEEPSPAAGEPPAGVKEPQPDVGEPRLGARESRPGAGEPSSCAREPQPDDGESPPGTEKPQPGVREPSLGIGEPWPGAGKPLPGAKEPQPGTRELQPDVRESRPGTGQLALESEKPRFTSLWPSTILAKRPGSAVCRAR